MGRGGGRDHPARRRALVRRQRGGVRRAGPGAGRGAGHSRSSRTPSARTPTSRCRIPRTWRGSRTGRSSAPSARRTPARRTTGPTRGEMRETLERAVHGRACEGRTMYVVPFSMGPLGSPISEIGVQLTDSAYVAVSMRIMTRMGAAALEQLGEDGTFVPCLHSRRRAARRGRGGRRRGRATTRSTSSTSPRRARSGPTARATAATRCSARSASRCGSPRVMARDEGWLAEHMLILKLTSPEGESKYVTGAFPSACGKTNLAMLIPTLEGWTVETVGDDIAWMKFGDDGRLWAINPEAGLLRRRARHGARDQPERDGDDRAEHDLHQLRAHRRRRRLVGGDDRGAARARDRLEAATSGRPSPTSRPRTPTRASPPPPRRTRRSRPTGRTRRACRSTRCCSAGAARPSCR